MRGVGIVFATGDAGIQGRLHHSLAREEMAHADVEDKRLSGVAGIQAIWEINIASRSRSCIVRSRGDARVGCLHPAVAAAGRQFSNLVRQCVMRLLASLTRVSGTVELLIS